MRARATFIFAMSISVTLYTFSKRDNSTKRPGTGTGTGYTGYSREPMSVMSPVIGFKMGTTAPSYNYAYSSDLGSRYYFITDWTYVEGLWYASMHTDVLATYKTEIGGSQEYILRAADSVDGSITDSLYPLAHGVTIAFDDFTGPSPGYEAPWTAITNPLNGGWYVVGIVNTDGAAIGGVSYYCLDNANFRTLLMSLLSSTSWTGMDFNSGEISEELYKSLFNPMQYIISCIWTPRTPPMGSQLSSFTFGWWTVPGVTAYPLSNPVSVSTVAATLTKHPQASSYGKYMNAEPFTRLKVVEGPFGDIPLDTSMYVDSINVFAVYTFDHITGKAMVEIGPDMSADGRPVDRTVTAQFGVPIQLAQITQDFLGAAGGAISTVGSLGRGLLGTIASIVTGNPVGAIASGAGGIAGAASGIVSAGESMLPQVQTTGMTGSFSAFRVLPRLQMEFWNSVPHDTTDRGAPYCKRQQINVHSGFLMIADPNIATSGTDAETAEVRQFMASGFFYE